MNSPSSYQQQSRSYNVAQHCRTAPLRRPCNVTPNRIKGHSTTLEWAETVVSITSSECQRSVATKTVTDPIAKLSNNATTKVKVVVCCFHACDDMLEHSSPPIAEKYGS